MSPDGLPEGRRRPVDAWGAFLVVLAAFVALTWAARWDFGGVIWFAPLCALVSFRPRRTAWGLAALAGPLLDVATWAQAGAATALLLFGVILVTVVTVAIGAAHWLWTDDDSAVGRFVTLRILRPWAQGVVIAATVVGAVVEDNWSSSGLVKLAVLVVPLIAFRSSAHRTTVVAAVAASATTGWSVSPLFLAGVSLAISVFASVTGRVPHQWHPLPAPGLLHQPLQAARCRLCDRRIARGDLLGARRALGSADGPWLQLRRAFLDLEERLYQSALSLAGDPALPAALSDAALILRGRALSGIARFDEARITYQGLLHSLHGGPSRLGDYLVLLLAENDFAAGDCEEAAQAAAWLTTRTADTCDYFMHQRALHLLAAHERDQGRPDQAARYADEAMDAMIRNRALARLLLAQKSHEAVRRLFGNRASMYLHVLRNDILSRSMTKRDDWEPESAAMALATARASDDLVELLLFEARAAAATDAQQAEVLPLVARALMELDRTRYLLAAQSSRSSWSRRFQRGLDEALSFAHAQQDHEFVAELLEFARVQTLPAATAEASAQGPTELELSTPPVILVHGRSRLARPAERHRPHHVELTHAAERAAGPGAWWLSYWSSRGWLYWSLVDPAGGASSGRLEFGADSTLQRLLADLERALPVLLPGEHPAEADFRVAASPLLTDPAAELALSSALGELLLPRQLVHTAVRRSADGHPRLPLAIAPVADLGHVPWSLLAADSSGETSTPTARLVELCDWVLAPSAALVCNAPAGKPRAPLALAIVDTTDGPDLFELEEARAQAAALPPDIRVLGGAHWTADLATLAQVEAALREIGPESTVAFMCHAVRGNVNEPSKGGLVLARPDAARRSGDRATEDLPATGYDVLGPLQIFAMKRRGLEMPSQVLLQACDTSALKDATSGEWLTIAPAFIAAGTQEVVSTLYPLADLPGTDDPVMRAALAGSSLKEAVGSLQRERLRTWNSGNASNASDTPFIWGAYATVAVQPPRSDGNAHSSPHRTISEDLVPDLARAIRDCLGTRARRLDSGRILARLLSSAIADLFDGGDLSLRPSTVIWSEGPEICARYLRMRDSGPATRLVTNGHALHVPDVVIEAIQAAGAVADRDGLPLTTHHVVLALLDRPTAAGRILDLLSTLSRQPRELILRAVEFKFTEDISRRPEPWRGPLQAAPQHDLTAALLALADINLPRASFPQRPEADGRPARAATEPLADLVLSDVVTSALHRAVGSARLHDRPIDTQTVLVALAQVDGDGDWTHLSISSVPLARLADPLRPDPRPAPSGYWNGVPLTETCTSALAMAARISHAYERGVLHPGELVLGLVADPCSGAAQAFGVGSAISHSDLITLVQDDLCRATLEDLHFHMGFDEA